MRSASDQFRLLGLSPSIVIILLLTLSALSRLTICMTIPILPDEAYYFEWSKHLDASYFSKGPAIAWTIWAGTSLFGPNLLGIRIFSVLLSAGTAWQVFLLARRWFDELTGVLAVLFISMIPLYSLGAVLMTIDPLSAFFWIWAANFFTTGWDTGRKWDWAMAGFAIGSGFLAKYLNGLEILAFLAFSLIPRPTSGRATAVPPQGVWALFGIMFVVGLAATLPVWWWNAVHGWPTIHHLLTRVDTQNWKWYQVDLSLELDYFEKQALVVVSPVLFLLFMYEGCVGFKYWFGNTSRVMEGGRLMHGLFLSVFFFYFVIAFHHVCEPNWPAISYLSLSIALAARAKGWLAVPGFTPAKVVLICAYLVATLETVALHSTRLLDIPQKLDAFSRTSGWEELAGEVQKWRVQLGDPEMLADAYKEAAVVSFYLPDQKMVYSLRGAEPASQFDMWPGIPGTRALYFTESPTADRVQGQYKKITQLEHFQLTYRNARLRNYYLYLIEH